MAKDEQIVIRMEGKLFNKAKRAATAKGLKPAAWARMILIDALDGGIPTQPPSSNFQPFNQEEKLAGKTRTK